MATGERKRAESSNLVLSALVVVVLSLGAALLLLFAFVIYLSKLINSLTLSLLLTGLALAVSAYICYKLSLSQRLRQLRGEYEQFMGFVILLKHLYECATERISQIVSLVGQIKRGW